MPRIRETREVGHGSMPDNSRTPRDIIRDNASQGQHNTHHALLPIGAVSDEISKLNAKDIQKMVMQGFLCPSDLQALASRQREHVDSVERGVKPGKDPFDTWIGHRAHNGRRIDLATESTTEKPILPGGNLRQVEGFFRDRTAMSDHRRQKVMKALNNGKSIKDVLTVSENIEYQKRFGQGSAVSGEGSSQGYEESNTNDRQESFHNRNSSHEESNASRNADDRNRSSNNTEISHYLEKLPRDIPWCRDRYRCDLLPGKTWPCVSGVAYGCVACAVKMFLNDCGISTTAKQLENALEPRREKKGFPPRNIPSALKTLGLTKPSIEYIENADVSELQRILKKSKYSIFVTLNYEMTDEENQQYEGIDKERYHEVLLDYIETNSEGKPLYFWIRDNHDTDGPYKITTETWLNAWSYRDVVVCMN